MNPLVVLGCIREEVDLLLSDQAVTAATKIRPGVVGQVIDVDGHHDLRH